ncbi:N(5)-(carboxyethyl)ornithine synthase [Sanguibacter suaedae]|uniref:N(5)-(Carboxyethyl)ornithine synthase n=1 Tax=Sanguibacter suaedae TaxID=2795737 RepID=A0A934M837_9MICO|nr:N(5)-(carboxyethyl)ornithine synthase [Sanguibacter suaedae]MBI9116112.1 N(5)-(carboxyethyl)ornithine synthase [Sanguibacter suaedae]
MTERSVHGSGTTQDETTGTPDRTRGGGPLTLGVVATSRKPDERRLPLHPEHLVRIDADVRDRIVLETGYGESFGFSDAQLAPLVRDIRPRAEVVASSDVVLLPKPQASDLEDLRPGQTLWGWPHCVQDPALTQVAIDERLTLIAFEAMNHWASDGGFGLHVFHKNNELAGYCSVLHALQLTGATGDYGRPLRAVVIGFGATARGAVTALNAHGVHDVQVVTTRDVAAVGSPIHSARIVQLDHDRSSPNHVVTERGRVPLATFLAERDVVVNCTLQDTDAPLTYLEESDLQAFRPGSLVVDVSCDEAMGFGWARPTSFAAPVFTVGDHVRYYAVDHSPSYLWASATWELSEALLPFLRTVTDGPDAWETDRTIGRAVEIRDGRVVNPSILAFQGRCAEFPHALPVSAGVPAA